MLRNLTILIYVFAVTALTLVAQPPVKHRAPEGKDFFTSDSSAYARQGLPGEVGVKYTKAQDSLYTAAMALHISSSARFEMDTRSFSMALQALNDSQKSEQGGYGIPSMNIPASVYIPSPAEALQHQIHIANAMYVPNVLLRPMGTGNMQIGLGSIARFFGLTEDVSPNISYRVDETVQVTIVVYSIQAKVVATLFNGIQGVGSYEVVWNGRDDKRVDVPNGDYIAEVRIGTRQIIRKHIVVPFEK